MPAQKHTKKANSPKRRRQWQHVVDSVESRGGDHVSAIIQANGVLKRQAKKGRKGKRGKRR
jgi:hypothetical protein